MVSSLTDSRTKEQGWLYIKSAVCLRNAARTLPTSSHFCYSHTTDHDIGKLFVSTTACHQSQTEKKESL